MSQSDKPTVEGLMALVDAFGTEKRIDGQDFRRTDAYTTCRRREAVRAYAERLAAPSQAAQVSAPAPVAEPAKYICPRCKVDRFKEACPDRIDCPMVAQACAAQDGDAPAQAAEMLPRSFSDFIRNATPQEKEAVYVDVMERASARQREVAAPLTDAARDVLAERERQVSVEGWTPEHDDQHDDGSMAIAAACYALADQTALEVQTVRIEKLWEWTGWERWGVKTKDRRRNLVRAAALAIAEIERGDRARALATTQPGTTANDPAPTAPPGDRAAAGPSS